MKKFLLNKTNDYDYQSLQLTTIKTTKVYNCLILPMPKFENIIDYNNQSLELSAIKLPAIAAT